MRADIAEFYRRLNLHRLESTLSSIGVDPWLVSTINEVLFYWAGRDSYGLPVGGNASRILAEAALLDVDSYLERQRVAFVRFVDDYRFFAPSAETAHSWLMLLIERLQLEGLVINQPKTAIEPIKRAEKERPVPVRRPTRIIAGMAVPFPHCLGRRMLQRRRDSMLLT